MDKLRKVLSGEGQSPDEESGILAEISDATTLSWSTRIKAFIILFVIGILFSFLGSFCLFIAFHKGLVPFAVFYTLGNIMSMGSTCFLMGPLNQLKRMFAPTRAIATVIVLVMFCLTLVSAFYFQKAGLCLLFILFQSLALTWYSISYIPYARDAVKGAINSCIG